MIGVAVLGHGVVGSGVAELLLNKKDRIAKNVGQPLVLKRILDLYEFDVPYASLFTKNIDDIVNDPEIHICAEVMGGVHPAFDFSKRLLEAGKSVVTSNKELVAYKGAELLKIAKEHGVNYYFEASVGGGIPVLHPLHQCLGANDILEIQGILNGTTNYILTKMLGEGTSFETALSNAQKLGYAERNPAADVEGADAARKICILASMVSHKQVLPEQIFVEGISALTVEDAQYAKSSGHSLKLIGRMKELQNGKMQVMVSPMMLPDESPLSSIHDVFNGVLVHGDATGDVLFYGKGAGKEATASAVVGDIMDAAKYPTACPSLYWENDGENYVEDYRNTSSCFYLRVQGAGAKEALSQKFGVVTYLERENQPSDEVACITGNCLEREAAAAIDELVAAGFTVLGKIRVAE